jgi:Lysophospholipase L1 and related esterases
MSAIDSTDASVKPTRPPHRISAGRKLAYAAVCLLVFLLLCEAAVRARAWLRYGSPAVSAGGDQLSMFDPKLGLSIPRPGYQVSGQRHSIKINSLGFRGSEFTPQKPGKTVRIACVGGSTTFCTGVSSNDAAWPHLLQQRLQKEYPDVNVEVINAGVAGYNTTQSLINLRERVLPLDPDLVIFYEGQNEMAHDTLALAKERGLVGGSESYLSPVTGTLSKYSLLFDLAYKNVVIRTGGGGNSTKKLNGLPQDLTKNYVNALAEMQKLTKERCIPLVLSTFVVKYRRNQERPEQVANADIAFYYMPWMSMDDLLDGTDAYNAAVLEFGSTSGVPVVDDREVIPADAEHFVDCCHLADKGCARMAERFFSFLEQQQLVRPIVAAKLTSK